MVAPLSDNIPHFYPRIASVATGQAEIQLNLERQISYFHEAKMRAKPGNWIFLPIKLVLCGLKRLTKNIAGVFTRHSR